MKYLLVTIAMVLSAGPTFAAEGLNDAFQAALQSSEQDHKNQQVAFDVDPDQVEKATFKKSSQPTVIDVPSTFASDIPTVMREHVEINAQKQQNSEDLAQMAKEVSDIK